MSDATALGFVLHRRSYRETSLLVDLFTAEAGRIGLIARGARPDQRGRMRFDLEPFVPVEVHYRMRGELGQLRRAEACGAAHALTGAAAIAGMYLGELLQRLLPREAPHPTLFMAYASALATLAAGGPEPDGAALRGFEWALVEELGLAPDLSVDLAGADVDPAGWYRLLPEQGLLPVAGGVGSYGGAALLALAEGRIEAGHLAEQRRLLRELLSPLLGSQPLRSRELLRELKALALA